MILDARGRPLTRRIGFTGGLEVERGPRTSANLVSAVGCERVWPGRDEEEDQAPDKEEQIEVGQAEALSVEH